MNASNVWSKSSLGALGGFVFGATILVLAWGCGDTLPKIPTYAEAEAQAQKDLKLHVPAETTLFDGGLGDAGKDIALPKGTPAPFAGALVGEKRYIIYKAVQIDRALLIKKYHAEALAARAKEIILAATTKGLKDAAQRNWYERNSLWIGIIAGAFLGTALTVGLVYGLTGGEGIK